MAIEYYKGAELPDIDIYWYDSDGAIVNFSSGYTFTVKVGTTGQAAVVTKTTGITGLATAPNIHISWAAAELDTLNPGDYTLSVIARETATNKDRVQNTEMTILATVN